MSPTKPRRTEREVIVMSLSMTYAVFVGFFAAVRLYQQDWIIGILDVVLAAFGLYVFFHVWMTRKADVSAYAIAIISVVGTIATIALKGSEQAYWAYPSAALIFYLLPTRHALILWGISAVIIVALIIDLPGFQLMSVMITLFITSFFCHLFSNKMYQQHDRLRRIANEDVLTQIKNRRAFNQNTAKLAHDDRQHSAVLFDLDHFKQVNDYFGHTVGDEVLIQTTEFIKDLLKPQDEFFRIGGDEFAIISPGQPFDYTYQLAKEIHQSFGRSQINEKHNITLSMAVAQKEADETIEEWVGRLDSALYHAKRSGRNKIQKAIRH